MAGGNVIGYDAKMPGTKPRPTHAHVIGDDGRARCPWPGADPLYVAYHDTDWGVPERDGRALFEKLILDGFQAGLSWITILRKRPAFRMAFDGFQPETIARYGADKIEVLMADAGIIRNRQKIVGTIESAKAWLVIEAREGFSPFLWKFVDGAPVQNAWKHVGEVPVSSPASEAMSKALKAEGFKFCGPTIVYAFMQATGMINDHLVGCHRHAECAALAKPTKKKSGSTRKPHPEEQPKAASRRTRS